MVPINLKAAAVILSFIWSLDGIMAVNRWWIEDMAGYQQNIIAMVLGSLLFSLFASRSRLDFLGLVVLSVAIFFTANYEIGGPSKFYLTPFDPLFGIEGVFRQGVWMGMTSGGYRHTLAIALTFLAALILSVSRARRSHLGVAKQLRDDRHD